MVETKCLERRWRPTAVRAGHKDVDVKRDRKKKPGLAAQLILAFIVAVTAVLLWLFAKSLSPAPEKDRMVVPAPPQASSDRAKPAT